MAKKFISIENKTSKTFSYSLGGVKLDFTLRTDVKTELKDFLECLKMGVREVEQEISK